MKRPQVEHIYMAVYMAVFDACPRSGHKSSPRVNIYKCKKCGEIFCSKCMQNGRCPECGSNDFRSR